MLAIASALLTAGGSALVGALKKDTPEVEARKFTQLEQDLKKAADAGKGYMGWSAAHVKELSDGWQPHMEIMQAKVLANPALVHQDGITLLAAQKNEMLGVSVGGSPVVHVSSEAAAKQVIEVAKTQSAKQDAAVIASATQQLNAAVGSQYPSTNVVSTPLAAVAAPAPGNYTLYALLLAIVAIIYITINKK